MKNKKETWYQVHRQLPSDNDVLLRDWHWVENCSYFTQEEARKKIEKLQRLSNKPTSPWYAPDSIFAVVREDKEISYTVF